MTDRDPPTSPRPHRAPWALLRPGLRRLGLGAAALFLAAAGGWLALPRVLPALLIPEGIDFEADQISPVLPSTLVFSGVRVRWDGGTADADTVRVGMSLRWGRPELAFVRLVRPHAVLGPGASARGGWTSGDTELSVRRLEVEDGTLEGEHQPEAGRGPVPWRIDGLRLVGEGLRLGSQPAGAFDELSFQASASPLESPITVRGRAVLDTRGPSLDLEVVSSRSELRFDATGRWAGSVADVVRSFEGNLDAAPFDLRDLTPFVPQAIPTGTVEGTLAVAGPGGRAAGTLALDLADGGSGTLGLEVEAGPGEPIRATLSARLDLRAEAVGLPGRGPLAAEIELDVAGATWTEASGLATGRFTSAPADVEGRFDVELDMGRATGTGALLWGTRRVALEGEISASEEAWPWRLRADIEQGVLGRLRIQAAGRERRGEVDLAGRISGKEVRGHATLDMDSRLLLSLRVDSVSGQLDSARVEIGRSRAGDVQAQAFRGAGRSGLSGHWEEGRLTVEKATLTGWGLGPELLGSWSGTARGWIEPSSSGARGRLSVGLDSIVGGRLHGFGGTTTLTLDGSRAEVTAELSQPGQELRVDGRVERGEGGWQGTLLELAARRHGVATSQQLDWRGPLTLGPSGWEGQGRMAFAFTGGKDGPWHGQADAFTVDGDVEAAGTLTGPEGTLRATLRARGGWKASGPLEVRLTTDGLRLPRGGADAVPGELSGDATLEAPRWSEGLAEASLTVLGSGAWAQLPLDTLRVEGQATDAGMWDVRARLRGDAVRADVDGMARLEADGVRFESARVQASVTRADALAAATGGALRARAELEATMGRREVDSRLNTDARLTFEEPEAGGWRAQRVALSLDDGRLGTNSWGAARVSIEGMSVLGGAPLDLDVDLHADDGGARLAATLGPDVALALSGPPPEDRVVFDRGYLVVVTDTLRLAQSTVLDLRPDRQALEYLRLEGSGSAPPYIALTAELPREREWTLEGEIRDLPVPEAFYWVPLLPVRAARLSAAASLTGPPDAAPRGRGSMRLETSLDSDTPFLLDAAFALERDWTEVQARASLDGRSAELLAALPRVDGVGEPRLELEARDFPLDGLVSGHGAAGAIRGGRLDGRITRTGPEDRATLEGQLRIQAASWNVPRADVSFRSVDATLTGEEERIRVEASAESGAGSASVMGTVDVLGSGRGSVDATVRTDRFPIAWSPEFVLRTVGDLRVSGTVDRPHLEGNIRAESTEILLEAGETLEPIELSDEDRAQLRRRFGWRERQTTTGSWLPLEAMSTNLNVDVGGDVWIRRWSDPELAVALAGSVRIQKDPEGAFQYFGTLSPVASVSAFRQFGRRFAVRAGTIQLLGPLEVMEFTLEGRHDVASRTDPTGPEAAITMTLQGSPGDLSVVLASDPEMDQVDIVSYLLLGQPSGELGTTEGSAAAEAAAGIALSRVSTILSEAGARAIGLDVVDIEADGMGAVTLVVGRYLTPRLFVAVRQPVAWRPGPEATGLERLPGLEAELATARWLLLNLEGDAEGFGLKLRGRWGY